MRKMGVDLMGNPKENVSFPVISLQIFNGAVEFLILGKTET